MAFKSLELSEIIEIQKIVTIHYFEYMSDYSFPGERHDFWEFLCVDKGEVDIIAENNLIHCEKGRLSFTSQMNFIQ